MKLKFTDLGLSFKCWAIRSERDFSAPTVGRKNPANLATVRISLPPILRFKKYGDIKTYIAIIKFPTFMPALANGGAWF